MKEISKPTLVADGKVTTDMLALALRALTVGTAVALVSALVVAGFVALAA